MAVSGRGILSPTVSRFEAHPTGKVRQGICDFWPKNATSR